MFYLKKGTIVFFTEVGHRGFHYPTNDFTRLTDDSNVKVLYWVTENKDKVPVSINLEDNQAGVVWVDRKDLIKL
jgi:hypothetical protein